MEYRIGDAVRVKDPSHTLYRESGRVVERHHNERGWWSKVEFSPSDFSWFLERDLIPLSSGTDTLEIAGDAVSLVNRKAEKREKPLRAVRVEALLETLRKRAGDGTSFRTPPLPHGTVFYKRRGDTEAVIMEESPQVHTVQWAEGKPGHYRSRQWYRLAFPYVVIGFGLYGADQPSGERRFVWFPGIFYRNAPLASLADTLHYTNLKNVKGKDGRSCLGIPSRAASLAEGARLIREKLWSATFNDDYSCDGDHSRYAATTTGSIENWQKKSEEDPLFVLNVHWPKSRFTAEKLLECLLGQAPKQKALKTADDLLDAFWQTPEDSQEWAV